MMWKAPIKGTRDYGRYADPGSPSRQTVARRLVANHPIRSWSINDLASPCVDAFSVDDVQARACAWR